MAKNPTESKATTEAPKTKLVKPQKLVLACLAKSRKGAAISRREIANQVSKTVTLYAGRIPNETKTYRSLVDAGFVTEETVDVDGKAETIYGITDAGREALKAQK